MKAAELNMDIEGGSPWERTIWVKDDGGNPKDLTSFTAKQQIRETVEQPVILELATGSGITITGAEGKITLAMTAEQTGALGITRGVYDLFVYDGSSVPEKLLKGDVLVHPAVTR